MRLRAPVMLAVICLLAISALPFFGMGGTGAFSGESSLDSSFEWAAEWPMEGGGSSHTGQSQWEACDTNGSQRWKVKVESGSACSELPDIPAQPVIGSDGVVYVHSWDGYLYAIDYRGDVLWKIDSTFGWPMSPAIGDDGTIYIPTIDEVEIQYINRYIRHYYLDLEARDQEGELLWNFTSHLEGYPPASISSVMLAPDGSILIQSGILVSVFDTEYPYNRWTQKIEIFYLAPDGTLQWSTSFRGRAELAPAIAPDGTILIGTDFGVEALNPNGTSKWRFINNYQVDSSIAVGDDGTVYFGSRDSNVYALHPNGTLKWNFETGNYVKAAPAVGADGRVYAGSYNGLLYCLEPNGSLVWTFDARSRIISQPTIGANGTILVPCKDGPLHALDPQGNEKWNYTVGSSFYSSATIDSEGTIYILSDDLYLHAINTRWPSSPRSVSAILIKDDILVSWAPPSDEGTSPLIGYRLYRATNPDPSFSGALDEMELIADISWEDTRYYDHDIDNKSTYRYALVAYNEVGSSNPSGLVAAGKGYEPFIFDPGYSLNSEAIAGAGIFLVVVFSGIFASEVFTAQREGVSLGTVLTRSVRTVRDLILKPGSAFESLRNLRLLYAIRYFIGWFSILTAGGVVLITVMGESSFMWPLVQELKPDSIISSFDMLLMLLIFGTIALYILIGVVTLACLIVGSRKGFDETARAVIFGSTPGYLLLWVPFLVLIPAVWSLALQTLGFKKLHDLTVPRAVAVTVISIALWFVVWLGISIFLLFILH